MGGKAWAVYEVATGVVHVVPNLDLIEHVLDADACICGPDEELLVPGSGVGNAWMYTHHSLDGREAQEPQ